MFVYFLKINVKNNYVLENDQLKCAYGEYVYIDFRLGPKFFTAKVISLSNM